MRLFNRDFLIKRIYKDQQRSYDIAVVAIIFDSVSYGKT